MDLNYSNNDIETDCFFCETTPLKVPFSIKWLGNYHDDETTVYNLQTTLILDEECHALKAHTSKQNICFQNSIVLFVLPIHCCCCVSFEWKCGCWYHFQSLQFCKSFQTFFAYVKMMQFLTLKWHIIPRWKVKLKMGTFTPFFLQYWNSVLPYTNTLCLSEIWIEPVEALRQFEILNKLWT